MSTSVGTLTIEMAANVARLKADMDRALNTVEGTMTKMRKAAGLAVTALGAIGAGLSVTALAGWVKSGINAADAMDELSQRTGVAVKDLAGLQLAFKLGGMEGSSLQGAMTKLSVAVAGGNDAIKAMGIQTRNTDGTLKTSRQVLGEVADKFNEYEDGAAKSALAVQLFGKTGTDMLSVLAGGSAALDEFDAMARKLGLTIDTETAAKAAAFNDTLDLVGMGFQGIATQVAAELLPTLSGLADEFFTAMTEGDRLKNISKVLSAALRGVYSIGVIVVEVFYSLGKTLMTAGKQFMAIMKGDFAGAVDIGKEYANDLQKDWSEALARADKAWNTTGSTTMEAMATASRAAKKEAPVVNEETKKMAAEASKLEDQYKKLIDSIEDKTGTMLLESQGTAKLTEGQKLALKTMQDLQNGVLKLTDAQKQHLTKTLEVMLATEEETQALADEKKMLDEAAKERADYITKLQQSTDSLEKEIEKQQESNLEAKFGKEYVDALAVAKQRETAAGLLRRASLLEEAGLDASVVEELRKQAAALYELAELKEDAIHIKAAKDAEEAWKKASDAITEDLTAALMRGFENGKGFVDNITDYIKNKFKSTVAEFIIKPIMAPLGQVISGITGTGNAASGASNLFSLGSSLASLGQFGATGFMSAITGNASFATNMGAASNLFSGGNYAGGVGMGAGTLAAYGAGLMAGNVIGKAISNGFSAIGDSGNTAVNAGAIIGTILGGPIGGAIGGAIGGIVNRAFGMGAVQTTDVGFRGTFSEQGADLTQYQNWFQKGGWFRSNKSGTNYSAVNAGLDQFMDANLQLVSRQMKLYSVALGLPVNRVKGFTQAINLSFQGLSNEQIATKIADALAGYRTALINQFADYLQPLRMVGETLSDTLDRLIAIQSVSEVMNAFGGAFSNFARASVQARTSIIELAGGIEALSAKTQGFVQNFYTQEEQVGLSARTLVGMLQSVGFTSEQLANLDTKADFRALLEGLNLNTDAGQKQFVALLDVQQQFADISGYLVEQGTSLAGAAQLAPQIAALTTMFQGADQGNRDILSNINGGINTLVTEIEDLTSLLAQIGGVPGYATGGAYGGGLALVGEQGPELINFQNPGMVYNAAQSANLLSGGGEVANEIRMLRQEVNYLRAETRATATNTGKTTRILERVTLDGDALQTVPAA